MVGCDAATAEKGAAVSETIETHGIVYRELRGWKYELLYAHVVALPRVLWATDRSYETDYLHLRGRDLFIKARYAWDGASGPTFDTSSTMRASLVHDALVQLTRLGALPPSAKNAIDNYFVVLCRRDGMGAFRAWLWRQGVRMWRVGRPVH